MSAQDLADECSWVHTELSNVESLSRLPALLEQKELEHQHLKNRITSERALIFKRAQELKEVLNSHIASLHKLRQDKAILEQKLQSVNVHNETLASLKLLLSKTSRLKLAKLHLTHQAQMFEVLDKSEAAFKDSPEVALNYFLDFFKSSESIPKRLLESEVVSARIESLIDSLKNHFEEELTKELKLIEWPNSVNIKTSWTGKSLNALFNLYERVKSLSYCNKNQKNSLSFPTQILLREPLNAFRFHFRGKRPTNRSDKPEWYMSFALDLMRQKSILLEKLLTPVTNSVSVLMAEFCFGVVQEVQHTLELHLSSLLQNVPLCIHTIHEAIQFDKSVQDDFFDLKSSISLDWISISERLCKEDVTLTQWLHHELEISIRKLSDVLTLNNGFEFDTVVSDKSIVSANIFINLSESLTDEYRDLPPIRYRKLFFNEVQLPLFEHYLSAIKENLDKCSPDHQLSFQTHSDDDLFVKFESLFKLETAVNQVRQWAEVWSLEIALILQDPDGSSFEDISDAYRDCSLLIRNAFLNYFLNAFQTNLVLYDHHSHEILNKHSEEHKEISPHLEKSVYFLERTLQVMRDNVPTFTMEFLWNRIKSLIQEEIESIQGSKEDIKLRFDRILEKYKPK